MFYDTRDWNRVSAEVEVPCERHGMSENPEHKCMKGHKLTLDEMSWIELVSDVLYYAASKSIWYGL